MFKIRKSVNLILAMQKNGGIGYKNKLPWNSLPDDMRKFKQLTSQTIKSDSVNGVIMGRKTFESIGRPLLGRNNYIISRKTNLKKYLNVEYCKNLESAIISANINENVEQIFIIGGAEIYNQALALQSDSGSLLSKSYITIVDGNNETDTFINQELLRKLHYSDTERVSVGSNGESYYEWQPKNIGEDKYLNLLEKVLKEGDSRLERTGVGVTSIFAENLQFDISNTIPFLTTKKLAWKTMIKELLWFITGDTNNKTLQNQNVHIWDGNSSREYLDKVGLDHYPVGCLGPVYGHQWRHWGADYVDCDTNYSGKGIDQLQRVIDLIRTDPTSRRILMSAWNPGDQQKMALPPCHVLVQWYVRNGNFLDCQVYQRSVDAFLGLPFNISSYSVLTYMIAKITGLKPGKLSHQMGDVHIYDNHIEAVREQLSRQPYSFPTLDIDTDTNNIDGFKLSDFKINGYKSHSAIKASMAV